MNRDTELSEVLRHLPQESINLLAVQKPAVRDATLTIIRELVCVWEETGANFDPIQWELVLNGLANVITPLNAELYDQEYLVAMMLGAP